MTTNLPATYHLPTELLPPTLQLGQQLDRAYQQNAARLQRALEAALPLLDLDADQLGPEQDRQLEDYLVRARRTLGVLRQEREVYTQPFDRVRSAFVELEQQLDPKKAGSVTARLQQVRDAYAARLRAAELRRQDELRERILERQRLAEQGQPQPEPEPEPELELAPVPSGRTGVELTVTDASAYVSLLAFYLAHQQPPPPLEKLPKVQLGQLVTWAERHALTTGELVEHPGLEYRETFKTVAR